MKNSNSFTRAARVWAFCLMPMSTVIGQARSPVVDSVAHLDSAWARSYAVHDTALAMSILAKDILIVGGNGTMKSRERELADIRPQPGLTMHYFRTGNVVIECYVQACVVVGVASWEFEYNGRVDATRRRYSATWVRGGPLGWQMASLHISQALNP